MYQELYDIIAIKKDENSIYKNYISKLICNYSQFFKDLELRFKDTNRNNNVLNIGKDTENKISDLIRFIQYNRKPISVNEKNAFTFDRAIYFLNHLSNDMNPSLFENIDIDNLFAQILIIAYLNYRMEKIFDSANIEYWSSFNLSWKGFPTFYKNITERFLEFLKDHEISVSQCILKQNNDVNLAWKRFIEPFSNKLKEFFISESKKKDSIIKTQWANNIEEMNKIEDILYELILYNILIFHQSEYVKNITQKLHKIIFIESADKLGKTTFCEDIKALDIGYDKRDQKIKYFHFPTKIAYENFPSLNSTEFRQLGFTFDTLENLRKIMRDLFDNGSIYLIDRAILSTAVYSYLDFGNDEEKYKSFLNIFNMIYDEFFEIESEILKFVSMYQFVIVNEEPSKMKIEFDKDDVIEKDLTIEKWNKINNLYMQYIEKDDKFHCKAQDLPLGNLIKHYKIRYNNNEELSIREKQKERMDFFLKMIIK